MRLPLFSSSERVALLSLLLILLLTATLALWQPHWLAQRPIALTAEEDSMLTEWKKRNNYSRRPYTNRFTKEEPYTLFPFNPNQADSLQLRKLGLKPWMVRNILKYRRKGGQFKTKASFAKVYGLTPEKYAELRPFLLLPDTIRPVINQHDSTSFHYAYPIKLKPGESFELNQADTAQLKRLPGIGVRYAAMIVYYRLQLGGYCSLDQLREIRHLPDSVINRITPYLSVCSDSIHKINLNRASIERMQAHPYFNFYQAKVIYEHRRKRSPIRSLQELRLYEEFTPQDLSRLHFYVSF